MSFALAVATALWTVAFVVCLYSGYLRGFTNYVRVTFVLENYDLVELIVVNLSEQVGLRLSFTDFS